MRDPLWHIDWHSGKAEVNQNDSRQPAHEFRGAFDCQIRWAYPRPNPRKMM